MKSIDHGFYVSTQWKKARDEYLKKVNHLCERCLAAGIYEPAVVVHHKIYLTEENVNDPAVSLNFDNFEALCKQHHNEEHHGGYKKPERRWKFIEGDLVTYERKDTGKLMEG